MVSQAVGLTATPSGITSQSSDTFVVASSSDPRKPHIVNIFPNGKTNCSDCPGFKASSLCKHTIVVFAKLGRMDHLIAWLARTKRGKRGINFSKAITHAMPEGRGKKGNLVPKKRGGKSKTTTTMVIPCVSDAIPAPSVLIRTSMPSSTPLSNQLFASSQRLQLPPPTQEHHQLICNASSRASLHQTQSNPSASEIQPTGLTLQQPTGIMLQPPIFLPSVTCQPIPLYGVNSICPPTQSITFPKPAPGQFLIYLIKFCPSQTSKCFGCGNFLKQKDSIPEAPLDLVIV